MSDDLKPCPFCGGEASKIHASGLFERVYCKDCFAQTGGLHSDRAMAKKAWNTRPADAAIEELEAKLAKAVEALRAVDDEYSDLYWGPDLSSIKQARATLAEIEGTNAP